MTKVDTSKRQNILLVENDKPSIDITKFYLRNICAVDVAENGEDALALVTKNKYCVVLMDINLGSSLSGVDVAAEIKKHPDYSGIPIVALTAYATPSDKDFFLSAGFDFYLAKPFDKESLIGLIEKLLSKRD